VAASAGRDELALLLDAAAEEQDSQNGGGGGWAVAALSGEGDGTQAAEGALE
jgi:hypothetical protein